jgi:hypothetical protein
MEFFARILIRPEYEALVLRPEQTLRALLERLRLPWSEQVLRHHNLPHTLLENSHRHPSAAAAGRPISAVAMGRYRQELSSSEIALFQRIAAPWLERLGYL